MSNYRIEWRPDVLQDFAAVWQQLPPDARRSVNRTLDDFDHLLSVAPLIKVSPEAIRSIAYRCEIH